MTEAKKAEEIEALIAEFQSSGMRELHIRCEGFELYLSSDRDAPGIDATGGAAVSAPVQVAVARSGAPRAAAPAPAPATAHGHAPAPPAMSPDDVPDGAVLVRAPYMGTFYRAPKPGAPVYVDLGTRVGADTEMCLVEVMKLFTAVRAGVAGHVHAILATDGQMVAADQPLFVVVPG